MFSLFQDQYSRKKGAVNTCRKNKCRVLNLSTTHGTLNQDIYSLLPPGSNSDAVLNQLSFNYFVNDESKLSALAEKRKKGFM